MSVEARASKIAGINNIPSKRQAIAADASEAIGILDDGAVPIPQTDRDYVKARKKFEQFTTAMWRVDTIWSELNRTGYWMLVDKLNLKITDKIEDVLEFSRQWREQAEADKTPALDSRDTRAKRHAAELAYKLLTKYGIEPEAGPSTTYCKVAKLIHGGSESLLKVCKNYRAEMLPSAKAAHKAKKTKS